MKKLRIIAGIAAAGIAALGLAGCSTAGGGSGDKVTVNWWTWDDHQAANYKLCIPGFEKANPDITVKISQYNVNDYFTKLTAGFVSGTAPDAFQNSVPLLGQYAGQKQIMPLDDLIKKTDFDMKKFDIGVDSWKYTDGKQYGIPLDWAGSAIYFNEDMVKAAGLTDQDIKTMTWNPDDGGTFDKIVSHLTIDQNGKRGDEPGFDKAHVKTYGIGTLAAGDFNGQTSWNPFVTTLGWKLAGDVKAWPKTLPFDDPRLAKTLDYVRTLGDRGLMPKFGQFTVSASEQMGAGQVAMAQDGTWNATSITKVPNLKVGIAPTVEGPEGRGMISNSNANNIFVGTKHVDQTWKWVSYMGTVECQTTAGKTATFLPSIAEALQSTVDAQKADGVDISSFVDALKKGELYPSPPVANGQELTDTLQPMFEGFFNGDGTTSFLKTAQEKSEEILAKK
ncbi:sugar ABC transporter substrate-binding protein [Leifsonia sp. F6_8S_P_1B]|uniref:Sugar ABC transporter substrate-binding protein n=1 Tax=Leifsonia williamsii TaxID=3035919 RepID=A0ABT8KAI2_9MICO|nr:sugar ABC transporter substrate-binding protein [Leifsonia williamsii]MDN4614047.1 sugar ABC transporter substrate-binding protein [Leifsonia williamsii]